MKKYSIFGVELEFPYSFSLVASLSLGEAEQLLTDYLNDGDGGTINGVNAAVVSEDPLNASNDPTDFDKALGGGTPIGGADTNFIGF